MIALGILLRRFAFAPMAALWTAPSLGQAVLENVIVETYYVSDGNDATDQTGTPGGLATGSRTYRVYLDLCDSCALRSVFGDTNHVLSIQSTGLLFNHNDRGKGYGHEINNSALDEGTTALDSWLSLRAASNQKFGIIKSDDPDGSIVGGANNDGGSAGISTGLLVNADPGAGVPLTTSDGLVPLGSGAAIPPNFNVFGDDPSDAFLDSTLVSGFTSHDFRMACSSPGVQGPTASNRLLVAQVTTTGELSFSLNIEVELPDGSVIALVSSDSVLAPGETANGLLTYPPQCGCTDPEFLEYDPNAGCDDGSCQTTIVFGCMDTTACNFDPLANFNVEQLCCYGPDSCNGLDVNLICPGVGVPEPMQDAAITIAPNPVDDRLLVMFTAPTSSTLHVVDATGRLVPSLARSHGPVASSMELSTSSLPAGAYVLIITTSEGRRSVHRFIRE